MKPRKKLSLFLIALALCAGLSAQAQTWNGVTVGGAAPAGVQTTNTDGTITITVGGADIWGTSDQMFYRYAPISGTDWAAIVRVRSLAMADNWSKAELMAREGTDANARFLAIMVTPTTGQNWTTLQWRTATGGNADQYNTPGTPAPPYPNAWLCMQRVGDVFNFYRGTDGVNWTLYTSIDTAGTTPAGNDGGTTWGTPLPNPVNVGLAVTSHSGGNNTTCVFSDLQVVNPTVPATALGIRTDVQDATTVVGGEGAFSFSATNNARPAIAYPTYQWYKNGAAVAGCTKSTFCVFATAADNAAQIYCVATQPATTLSVTSRVATLTVNAGTLWVGGLKNEVFTGSSRADVYLGNTPAGDTGNGRIAGKLRWLEAFQDGGGYGDNASRRISGWFIPPADGAYTFYVAADDDTDVWLGTGADPTTKRIICQEMGWSPYNNWTNAGGGDVTQTAQKCSNTWTNGLGEVPNPAGIQLVGGQRYYLETIVHNGTGGDNGSLTAQLFTDVPPQNGSATKMTAQTLQLISWPPTTLTWSQQPINVTGSEGSDATFTARATADGEFVPHYQWTKYGTNVPGANGTAYTVANAQVADSGATIACIATVPLMNAITSTVVTLTVQQAVFEPGFMLNQKWAGQNRDAVANGTYTGALLLTDVKPGMGAACVTGEAGGNYTRKISGVFIPPATDRYDFWTTSDDQSDLYISLGNGTPAQTQNPVYKTMVAQETGWSGVLNWTGQGGGGTASQKCSQTWVPAGGTTAPYATGIQLTGGQRYYMEVIQNEGGGGDNVAVTFRRYGEAYMPVAGDRPRMVGTVVGFQAPQCQKVWFTLQPTNPAPILSGPNTATFYAFGGSDSTLRVGSIDDNDSIEPTTPQTVFFQWAKNGVDIPGATATTYTTPWLKPEDNGAQFACKMRALGYGTPPNTRLWSNSEPAILTVVTNTEVPTIAYSGIYTNWATGIPVTFISVTFSLIMDTNTIASPSAYSIPGMTVDSVQINRNDGRRVLLTVSGTPTFPLNITVTGARSWSGIAAASTPAAVGQLALTSADFGNDILDGQGVFVSPNPVFPSKLWLDGPKAYTIAAQGTDIWDTSDGFNFLYERKDGDFDVVLRQTAYSLPNRWAKVGLMMRELVDPPTQNGPAAGSRNWNIVNDPPNVPTLSDGNGANAVECNWRPTSPTTGNTGGASGGWGNGTSYAPKYPNAWVRLKRAGQVVSAYAGTDGMNWTELARMDVSVNASTTPLPTTMYVGICVTAHHNDSPLGPDYLPLPYEQQRFWNYASVDNYNSSYVAPPPSQTLTIGRQGGNIVISWTPAGGTLESTTNFQTWTPVGTANPSAPITPGATPTFYRVSTPWSP